MAGGDGRLTAEELEIRLESALTARTLGELATLTADLPAAATGASAATGVLVIEQVGGKTASCSSSAGRVSRSMPAG